MKKILVSIFTVMLLVPMGLWAVDAASDLMGLGMPAALAVKVSQVQIRAIGGASIPTACAAGELIYVTDSDTCADASGGGAMCICQSTGVWKLVVNVED